MGAIELTSSLDIAGINATIEKIKTPEDAAACVSELDTLEKMLKAAKRFNENARKFALLETMVYIRIADMGLEKSVHASKRRFLTWLKSLDEDGRKQLIDECGNGGVTAFYYYKHTVSAQEKEQEYIAYMRWLGGKAVKEFNENGSVELNKFFSDEDNRLRAIDAQIVKGFKDEIRNAIRKRGGHGLGDGNGVYVTVDAASSYASDLVDTKARSIRRDMKRLRETIHEINQLGVSLPTSEHNLEHKNGSYKPTEETKARMALALFGLRTFGALDDSEKLVIAHTLKSFFGVTVMDLVEAAIRHSMSGYYTGGLYECGFTAEQIQKVQEVF